MLVRIPICGSYQTVSAPWQMLGVRFRSLLIHDVARAIPAAFRQGGMDYCSCRQELQTGADRAVLLMSAFLSYPRCVLPQAS